MTYDKHREIVRENYNAIAKRVADEQFALFPNYAFDPVQLAHHVGLVIDELKRQRNEAYATLHLLHGGEVTLTEASAAQGGDGRC